MGGQDIAGPPVASEERSEASAQTAEGLGEPPTPTSSLNRTSAGTLLPATARCWHGGAGCSADPFPGKASRSHQ